MKTYVCIGCKQIHWDNDYSEKDGDFLIKDWGRFVDSVEKIKELKK